MIRWPILVFLVGNSLGTELVQQAGRLADAVPQESAHQSLEVPQPSFTPSGVEDWSTANPIHQGDVNPARGSQPSPDRHEVIVQIPDDEGRHPEPVQAASSDESLGHPLNKEDASSIVESSQSKGRDHCAICLGEFKGDIGVVPVCTAHHLYHQECINGWSTISRTCPTCRGAMIINEPSPQIPQVLVAPLRTRLQLERFDPGQSTALTEGGAIIALGLAVTLMIGLWFLFKWRSETYLRL